MSTHRLMVLAIVMGTLLAGVAQAQYEPTWDSLKRYRAPEWYKDAKFGIFIHWGPYAIAAKRSEWYPNEMYLKGNRTYEHHRSIWGDPSEFGYKDFIPMFRAQRWDPQEWVELFKKAGARFVVPVAEHHDGFAMYDSGHTKWNSVQMGPRRNVLGELAVAIRAAGMKLGASSHYAFNWKYYTHSDEFDTNDPRFSGLYGRPHAPDAPADREFIEHWYARLMDILDKYRPDLLYFDFGFNAPEFEPYRKRLAAEYYNRAAALGKEVVLNYKKDAYPDGTAVLDIERGKLDRIRSRVWQTDTMVTTRSWGYIGDDGYKSVDSLVDSLVDVVSKNAVLLLNVGPRADGTIPKKAAGTLEAMGKWLAVNGEAIYGTRPWHTYGEGPTRIQRRENPRRPPKPFTASDIRFTTKRNALYAICLDWPTETLVIKSLNTRTYLSSKGISEIHLLGREGKLEYKRDREALRIKPPAERPCEHAYAFKLTLAGEVPPSFLSRPSPQSQTLPLTEDGSPPPGATVLFGGKSLEHWTDQSGGPAIWKIHDGITEVVPLVTVGKRADFPGGRWPPKKGIQTKRKYQDFVLHVEFKVPTEGSQNSGIYLQRRYEIQIVAPRKNKESRDVCGSIYTVKKPDINVGKARGEWQSFDIRFRAARFEGEGKDARKVANARLSVVHNGVLIHDNVEVPHKTGRGDPEGPQPAPIMLQDHDGRHQFRNVWVLP